jgi:uracil-DNA glycosylase family 4
MSDFRSKPKMSISEIQPDYQSGDMPKTLHQTRRHQEVLYVAGEGPRDSGVMFVAPALEEDEAREFQQSTYGIQIRQPARYLKGDIGSVLRDSALSVGLDLDKHYYTAFIKWLLPRTQRNKPSKEAQEWAMPAFEAEVRECKPKFIICLGKLAFDQLVKIKISASDALGGWFWSDWAQARVMLMDKPYTLLQKPERLEQYRLLFRDVQRMITDGEDVEKVPLDYREIKTMEQLQALVKEWEDGDFKLFAQDNEWEGNNHIDGRLRSSQFCWLPGVAACLTFFDETGELHLGAVQHLGNSIVTIQPGNREVAPGEWYTDYQAVGRVLGRWLNRPDVRYVGHYIQADLPWLKVWLELDVYRKCVLDTAFAMNVLDEYSPVGLEWVALLFTDLGRYDLPLLLWKKANPQRDDAGYGKIPGEILVPYSCLRRGSLVQLGDGTWSPIHRLVKERYAGEVKSLWQGQVVNRQVTGWHRSRSPKQKWFRIRTASTPCGRWGLMGPVFTPDHRVMTQRGMVQVQELVPGIDAVVTDEPLFNGTQMSVILGSLLGDGGLTKRNRSKVGMQLSQNMRRARYAEWKADVLRSVLRWQNTRVKNQVIFKSAYCRQLAVLEERFPRHTRQDHARRKLVITEDLLNTLGPLGLAVWYQDDGTYTRGHTCRLSFRVKDPAERDLAEQWFAKRYGDVHYEQDQYSLMFSRAASDKFLAEIAPFMHEAVAYKANVPVGALLPAVDQEPDGLFADPVVEVMPYFNNSHGRDVRYCLTVEGSHNFLTEVGFVANCADADTPFRAAVKIMARLKMDGVWDYYQKILHPFVSDVFTAFCLHGLPMDLEAMDDMREVYHFAHDQFLEEFRVKITQQARLKLLQKCQEMLGFMPGLKVFGLLVADHHEALTKLLEHPDLVEDQQQTLLPFVKHLQGAPVFNPWSKPQMVRWLFEVLGLVPIKSTDQKEKGIRSMSWEKVLALPKDKQAEYKPATDQQTLQMLLDKEPLIDGLIDLTAIASICKAFLKEPTLDEETGEITREQGLHYHVCSDGAIRTRLGLTESSRPRSSSPNVLNLPSYVNGRIIEAMGRLFRKLHDEGRLPTQFERYLPAEGSDESPIKSVRSLIAARPGWCLPESDFRTAELRSLALQSGDSNMMKMMTESDRSFGLAKVGGKTMPVRLYYDAPAVNGIDKIDQVPEVLMSCWKDSRKLLDVLPDQLLVDEDGELLHPDHDLHWSLAEMVFCRPRELLVNKIHRRASKTANFSIVYDISSSTLERRIEVDTGKKPEPGTGQSLRDAWAKRYPRASDFLVELENIPREKGTYVAASGRKRRFHRHPVMLSQDSWRMTKGMFSAMGREMRNFPPQESVAATALRAAVWLQEFGRANNLEGYQIAVLYDSIVTHCPLRERHIWAAAHELYMFRANSWTYDGRVLKYPVDTEFNVGWSDRPPKDVQALWDSFEYEPVPPRLLPVLGWLRGQLRKHTP